LGLGNNEVRDAEDGQLGEFDEVTMFVTRRTAVAVGRICGKEDLRQK